VRRKLGLLDEDTGGTQTARAKRGSTRLDPLWSMQLKSVSEAATQQLNVEVLSARLVHAYDPTDRDVALFELESNQGLLHAILSRTGEFTFFWKR
jgi:hypothetical protein